MSGSIRGGCLRFACVVALALVLGVLGWVAILHVRAGHGFSLRFWDPAWWQPGLQKAAPAVQDAKEAARQAEERLWAPGGVMDQAEGWLRQQLGSTAAGPVPSPTPAPPPTQQVPVPAPAPAEQAPAAAPPPPARPVPGLALMEQDFEEAEQLFRDGFEHQQAANPRLARSLDERIAHLRLARDRFAVAGNRILARIDAYEAHPEHSPKRARDLRALLAYCQQLFVSARDTVAAAEGR